MKKFLMASAATALMAGGAMADGHSVKLGVMLGFTGPIESLTPAMAAGAELAMSEVSESGKLLGGKKVMPVRADSTCVDLVQRLQRLNVWSLLTVSKVSWVLTVPA